MKCRRILMGLMVTAWGMVVQNVAWSQSEEIRKALAIRPNQPNVDYDVVADADLERCQLVRAADVLGTPGWIVRDGDGRVLRQFLDLNRDGQLDQWSFFKNGIEVYRDVDSNYDRKADQYRWMGTAGIRWGVDTQQTGQIDFWKNISAEEVVAEVFAAVKQRDRQRFVRLLPTPEELASLKLGEAWERQVTASVRRAAAEFEAFAQQQQAISAASQFVHFGSSRPCLVPAQGQGNQLDLIFHDHAAAVFQTEDRFDQLAVGTLIKIGEAYRVLELPAVIDPGKPLANGGLFFQSADDAAVAVGIRSSGSSNEQIFEWYSKIEELNKQLTSEVPTAQASQWHQQRADLYWQIIAASAPGEDRQNWIRNAVDVIANAYQDGSHAEGLAVLTKYQRQLEELNDAAAGDYVAWRALLARFAAGMEESTADRAAVTSQYLQDLEAFVEAFGTSEFAPEALLNLAMYAEVSERDDDQAARQWYAQLARDFADTSAGRRARGAISRLTSAGKPLAFQGPSLDGRSVDVAAWRGKVVVIHFWATWCDACIEEFPEFQRLAAKYGDDLVIVGANLDDSEDALRGYLREHRQVTWTQLFAEGGMEESPLAEQLGIPTLPWIVVLDPAGHAANTNAAALELDREIQRLLEK